MLRRGLNALGNVGENLLGAEHSVGVEAGIAIFCVRIVLGGKAEEAHPSALAILGRRS